MRTLLVVVLGLVVGLGCARVRVEAPKDPIKVDISMRLDIYQHIEKDIDRIEDKVTGSANKGPHSFVNFFVTDAYADEGFGSEVEGAVLRRQARRAQLMALQSKGIVGENKSGLLEIRVTQSDSTVADLLAKENADRMIIYGAVAKKNGGSVSEVEKLYAKRLQDDAVAGTPIEIFDSLTGTYQWRIK